MVYSPNHKVVVFGGGDASRKVWKMTAAGVITQLDDVPAGITSLVGPGGAPHAMTFANPANGNIVVMERATNWFELNPTAAPGSQWSVKSGTAQILAANTVDGSAYGVVCATIPEYGVVFFVKAFDIAQPAQQWLWKP